MPGPRGLGHRLDKLELFAGHQRRLIRERIERIMHDSGARLSPAEVASIVARNVGTPARIRVLRDEGMTGEQIISRLARDVEADAV